MIRLGPGPSPELAGISGFFKPGWGFDPGAMSRGVFVETFQWLGNVKREPFKWTSTTGFREPFNAGWVAGTKGWEC